MRILNLFKVSYKAIILNKMRTLLTMLGIIIGVASVITMLAIGEGSKESIKSTISSMGSNIISIRPGADKRGGVRRGPGEGESLTLDDYYAIKKNVNLLSYISPMVNSGGQVIKGANNWPSTIYGVNTEYLDIKVLSLKSGSMFTDNDIKASSKVVVLGQTVVENIFTDGEDPVGQTIRFNKIPFKVIGVLEEKGTNTFGQDQDDIILAPYTTIQKRIMAIDHINDIISSAVSEAQSPNAVDEITAILRKQHKLTDDQEDDFTVRSMEELITTFSSTSEMLTVLLVAIASISLLIGGIGIMNIMYVSVKERTREIGLRMAVGGKSYDILVQFLIESILISVTGGLLGVLLGLSATYTVSNILHWPVSITSFSILISFAVCAVTGIFFGWYPAKKASDLDPIVALRYE